MKSIAFDRVKRVVLENVPHIANVIDGPKALLTAVQMTFGEGKPTSHRALMARALEKAKELISRMDVRCLDELLEWCPRGLDNRLPGWLYEGVDASLEDEGWVLCPGRAA